MPMPITAQLGRTKRGPECGGVALTQRLPAASAARPRQSDAGGDRALAVAPARGDDGGAGDRSRQAADAVEAVERRHGRPAAGLLDLGGLGVHCYVGAAGSGAEEEGADEEEGEVAGENRAAETAR